MADEHSGDVDELLADLARWAADARVEEAAAERSRERWLRQQSAEQARLTGIALDLAEQGATATVATTTGRQHRGTVVAVGEDFVAVAPGPRSVVLIAFAAITLLRPPPGRAEGTGDRSPPHSAWLADVLTGVAADRAHVRIALGPDVVSAELRAVGADVVTLRIDGAPPTTAYARLSAVTEVWLGV